MGKEHWARILGDENLPGPASLDVRREPGVDSPRFTIKQKYPDRPPSAAVPYRQIPTTLCADSPKYTMRPRYPERDEQKTPGPSYIPPAFGSELRKTGNATFGPRGGSAEPRRTRHYVSYSQNPNGPAEFDARRNPRDARAPAFTIAPAYGDSWMKKNSNPSADAYTPNFTCGKRKTPDIYIGKRLEMQTTDDSPGPGAYDIPSSFDKKNTRAIGGKCHRKPAKNTIPGPGTYEVAKPIGSDARRIKIGEKWRSKSEGGGQYYKIKREFDEPSARVTIAPKTARDPRRDEVPGPGAYTPEKPKTSRSCSFGRRGSAKTKKNDDVFWIPKSDTPGPGTYNVEPPRDGPSFSLRDGYAAISNETISPGPKYLPENDTIGKRSPRFTCRPRTEPTTGKSATQDAGYVVLPPHEVPPITIHRREYLNLLPE